MLEIKLILCPVDFSEFSVRAYQYALSLAEHYGAKVVAQHIVELTRYPYADYVATTGDYAEFCRALHDGARQQLEAFLKAHGPGPTHSEFVVHEGTAPDSILSYAEKRKADLIVIGTHGRRGYDRLVLGSVTNRVMRRTSCPVLAICTPQQQSAAETQKHTHQLHRVLFCTDFSENSERAFRYAVSATEEYNAELIVLHVLEEIQNSSKVQAALATIREQLDKMIQQEIPKALKIKTAVRVGKPYQQIIELAEKTHTDTIVMGVRGRGAVDLAVFGSTTYRVLQLGPCPVLAVHL
ncbi:MAG TPA: universal stress protein [Candidatus Binatia bacterium]|jgi:nucleotide-binding universal stress UspA family protein|nr:universal stress protein [Candidatus Binatia bacterium]